MKIGEKYIVLLHPYRKNPQASFNLAKLLYKYFAERHPDKVIFSPILHTHNAGMNDEDFYVDQDLEIYSVFPVDNTRFLFFGDVYNSIGCRREMSWCINNKRRYSVIMDISSFINTFDNLEDLEYTTTMAIYDLEADKFSFNRILDIVKNAFDVYKNTEKERIRSIVRGVVFDVLSADIVTEFDIDEIIDKLIYKYAE